LIFPYPPADLQHCFRDAVGIPDRALTVSEVEELWKQDRIRLIVDKRCGERMQAWYSIALPATIPTAAIPTAATPAVVTARRRRRRNLTAAAVPTVATTVSVTAPTVTATVSVTVPTVTAPTVSITAPTEGTRTKERRTKERGSKEEAKCFGFGGNGGSSKWESCCEHDGYPA
jgi:hypothetical protein